MPFGGNHKVDQLAGLRRKASPLYDTTERLTAPPMIQWIIASLGTYPSHAWTPGTGCMPDLPFPPTFPHSPPSPPHSPPVFLFPHFLGGTPRVRPRAHHQKFCRNQGFA